MRIINDPTGARPIGLASILFTAILSMALAATAWFSGPWRDVWGRGLSSQARLTYLPQPGTPAGIPNFIQPEQGCAWAGVGGQVFDQSGAPVSGMALKLSGYYQGQTILKYAVANSSQQFGPGGFDFYLGSQPLAVRTLSLQLFDTSGAARSAPIQLGTFASCQQNLLVVNLVEVSLDRAVYLPIIRK